MLMAKLKETSLREVKLTTIEMYKQKEVVDFEVGQTQHHNQMLYCCYILFEGSISKLLVVCSSRATWRESCW